MRSYQRGEVQRTTFVWLDSASPSHCRGCGASVVFAKNARTDKFMPFTGAALRILSTEMRETKPGHRRQAAEVDLADSHFATCPKARDFRSRAR